MTTNDQYDKTEVKNMTYLWVLGKRLEWSFKVLTITASVVNSFTVKRKICCSSLSNELFLLF